MSDAKVKLTLPDIEINLNILYSTCTGNAYCAILPDIIHDAFEVREVRQHEQFDLNRG